MKRVFLTLALIGTMLAAGYSQQIFIYGEVINTNGVTGIPISITAIDSLQGPNTFNVVTDSLNQFAILVNSNPNLIVLAEYTDCNGILQVAFGFGGTGAALDSIFIPIDYCPNNPPNPFDTVIDIFVDGCLINADSLTNVPLQITVYDSIQTDTTIFTSGPDNYFAANIKASIFSLITITTFDCNGDSLSILIGPQPFATDSITGLKIDYCPGTITWPPIDTSCNALFTVTQATDPNGNPIPNQAVIWDQSTGSNLQHLWLFGSFSDSAFIVTFDSMGMATPTYSFNNTGPYFLCLWIFSDSGCFDYYCDTIEVDSAGYVLKNGGMTFTVVQGAPTGIEELPEIESVKAFPVPAQNLLNLSFTSRTVSPIQIQVYDFNGRQLSSIESQAAQGQNRYELNVSDFAGGIYYYRIASNEQTVEGKFIKQ